MRWDYRKWLWASILLTSLMLSDHYKVTRYALSSTKHEASSLMLSGGSSTAITEHRE